MKLLHSIACAMIGFAAVSSVAPSQARADRIIEVDPSIAAGLRFGWYLNNVTANIARYEATCVSIRDELASDLSGVTSRSARKQLIKAAKQDLKAARDWSYGEIETLTREAQGVLVTHSAGVALLPAVQEARRAAIQDVNGLFQDFSRECQAMLR